LNQDLLIPQFLFLIPIKKANPKEKSKNIEGSGTGAGVTSKLMLPELSMEFQSLIQKLRDPPSTTEMWMNCPMLFVKASLGEP